MDEVPLFLANQLQLKIELGSKDVIKITGGAVELIAEVQNSVLPPW